SHAPLPRATNPPGGRSVLAAPGASLSRCQRAKPEYQGSCWPEQQAETGHRQDLQPGALRYELSGMRSPRALEQRRKHHPFGVVQDDVVLTIDPVHNVLDACPYRTIDSLPRVIQRDG